MPSGSTNIDSLQDEKRVFPPPTEFSEGAQIRSLDQLNLLRQEAHNSPEAFWARMAEELDWFKRWEAVLEWTPPHAKWFIGGKINIAHNCLDRHVATWRRNKAAFIWEGEPGEQRTLTYGQLHREVCRFANVLKKLGAERVIALLYTCH